ncbi:hypothetical protein ACI3KS_00460 [Microbacterium sp. ZW T5_45]|uniref:hypothetical protein n=1 Tax=Microbacterium sp. ZW T5_45 TaxID=3378080 RepID=UPI0038533EB3
MIPSPEIAHARFLASRSQTTKAAGREYAATLETLPDGSTLRGVTARSASVAGRDALRVELTDQITTQGIPGVDYVDQPTYVELPVTLRTGSIEVDILSRLNRKTTFDSRAFAGIAFHASADASAFQSVYLRPLNGRKADPPPPRDRRAIQYFAYPEWPFDTLRDQRPDEGYEAAADIGPDEWITLNVRIDEDVITARVDGTAVLRVERLLAAPIDGAVGLFVDIGTEAFFSNLTISQ